MASGSGCPPFYPLHRITVVLRHLRQSTWLTHLHRYHPHPQSRYQVDRLFRHIDQLQDYITRHRLLPAMPSHRSSRPPRTSTPNNNNNQEHVLQLHHQFVELRRIHQHQLRESLTRIRHCIRPLRQYLVFYQPDQLIRYHQSMNILDIFTTHL